MALVRIYRHHNSGKLASTLTPLAFLNVLLGELAEFIMASLLSSSEPRTTISIGFSDPYGLPIVSICGVPVHSNIYQATVYEISKHWILQYWVDRKLTQMEYWEGSDLTKFEQAWDRTTVHMSHFITKCRSNTLYTMKILQK